MAKPLLTLCVCILIICTGVQSCILSKYKTCALNFQSEATAVGGYDFKKLCDLMNKLKTCSEKAHCSKLTKASLDLAYQNIPGGDPCSSNSPSRNLSGVSGNHGQSCILLKYNTCAFNFHEDVIAAGYNLKKRCDSMNKLKTCSEGIHCSTFTKATLDAAFQDIPGGDPCSSNSPSRGVSGVTVSGVSDSRSHTSDLHTTDLHTTDLVAIMDSGAMHVTYSLALLISMVLMQLIKRI